MNIKRFATIVAVVTAGAALTLTTVGINSAGAAPDAVHRTVVKVVRPVDGHGTPAAGFTVRVDDSAPVSCQEAAAPSAVSDNIHECTAPNGHELPCWKSGGHTVLCSSFLGGYRLTRFVYSGSFVTVAAHKHRVPGEVDLQFGPACTLGKLPHPATVIGHPDWVSSYICPGNALFGPAGNAGLDMSSDTWFANIAAEGFGPSTTSVRTNLKSVGIAYFVGTAS